MKKFLSKISSVRKLVVAIVGLVMIVGAPFTPGITEDAILGVNQDLAVQILLSILTALGVYRASNEPVTPA